METESLNLADFLLIEFSQHHILTSIYDNDMKLFMAPLNFNNGCAIFYENHQTTHHKLYAKNEREM